MDSLKISIAAVIISAIAVLGVVFSGGDSPSVPFVPIGGTTNFDELDINWVRLGDKVSSTTDPVWKFAVSVQISGTENQDRFLNTQRDLAGRGINLIVTDIVAHVNSNASTTMRLVAATSTGISLTNYVEPAYSLFSLTFATSTGDMRTFRATTSSDGTATAKRYSAGGYRLRYGEALNFMMLPGGRHFDVANGAGVGIQKCNGGVGGYVLKEICESATSTKSGLKPVTFIIEGYATQTPMFPDRDIR